MDTKFTRLTILCLFMCFIAYSSSYGQSKELLNSYNQVVATFKNYTFVSENVHNVDYDEYVTKSMSIKYKYPNIIISSVEGFRSSWAWTGDDRAKPGTHTIEIPLESAKIRTSTYGYSATSFLAISSHKGITYTVNGKKELWEEYCIYGSKLNIEKLYNELLTLQRHITNESYTGNLGYQKESPKQTPKAPTQKTINNKYEL